MLIKFNEEQTMIRDMVREFTKNEVEPRDYYMDQNDAFDRELYAKFNELGLGGVLVPEEYGGMGSDYVTSTIIVHELAKGSASFALAVEISHVAAEMITNWGTEEQKKAYLPRVANGDLFAFGLTEASAGSDAAGIRSVAVKNEDGTWTLNGGKSWITNSGEADVYLILAKTNPEAGAKGISAFIIPKETPGLVIAKHEKKMGMRGSSTCALSFDNIQLPADALLGPEGIGFKIAMSVLDGGRISCAAIATALSQHAMDIAKKYANERITFGKPIAKHQGVMFKFGDMSALISAMRQRSRRHPASAPLLSQHRQSCLRQSTAPRYVLSASRFSAATATARTSMLSALFATRSCLRSARAQMRFCVWLSAAPCWQATNKQLTIE